MSEFSEGGSIKTKRVVRLKNKSTHTLLRIIPSRTFMIIHTRYQVYIYPSINIINNYGLSGNSSTSNKRPQAHTIKSKATIVFFAVFGIDLVPRPATLLAY